MLQDKNITLIELRRSSSEIISRIFLKNGSGPVAGILVTCDCKLHNPSPDSIPSCPELQDKFKLPTRPQAQCSSPRFWVEDAKAPPHSRDGSSGKTLNMVRGTGWTNKTPRLCLKVVKCSLGCCSRICIGAIKCWGDCEPNFEIKLNSGSEEQSKMCP
jgi:hypothetical protein